MAELLPGWTVEHRLVGRRDRLVVRARRGGDGPVVLKATLPGATWRERARLRHEGRLLDRLRGPGVVDLLDVIDTRGRSALVLRFVPMPLSVHPGTDLEPLRVTIERLHRAGVVHGAIHADHVLLTADGEPVLCGFGSAHRSTSTGADATDLARLL